MAKPRFNDPVVAKFAERGPVTRFVTTAYGVYEQIVTLRYDEWDESGGVWCLSVDAVSRNNSLLFYCHVQRYDTADDKASRSDAVALAKSLGLSARCYRYRPEWLHIADSDDTPPFVTVKG
jgi:hypothetical protein